MVFPFHTHPFQTLWLALNYSSLLPGKLIDLTYLKRSSKINSNVTHPYFQYFISPHSDFHRKKITSVTGHLSTLKQQLLTIKNANGWGWGSPKNPFCFQLLCQYLRPLASREHNSIWKSFLGVYTYWGYLKFSHLVLSENYILLLDPQFSASHFLAFFMDTEYHPISAKPTFLPCCTALLPPLLNYNHSHLPWSHCDSASTFSVQMQKSCPAQRSRMLVGTTELSHEISTST